MPTKNNQTAPTVAIPGEVVATAPRREMPNATVRPNTGRNSPGERTSRYPQSDRASVPRLVVPTFTLEDLNKTLAEIRATFVAAGETYAEQIETPFTAIDDAQAVVDDLQEKLATAQAELERLTAIGTPEKQAQVALMIAERRTAGLANTFVRTAARKDAERVFRVSAENLPKDTLKNFQLRHEAAVKGLTSLIKLSPDTQISADEVTEHGARIEKALDTLTSLIEAAIKE